MIRPPALEFAARYPRRSSSDRQERYATRTIPVCAPLASPGIASHRPYNRCPV